MNKLNYSVASEIWGEFQVIIKSGYVTNDNGIEVKGTFHCNNGGILEFEQLDSYVSQTPTPGFQIIIHKSVSH